jgi:RNA polymerase sigma-70 factor (ECF subfamily)
MPERESTDQALATLMRRAQDGDKAAYASLLRAVAPIVRQAVRRRLRWLQPADVEDLVQDILLSLHAVRATYDPTRPFRPWLFGIVQNRTADGARRLARRFAREVTVDEWPETFSASETNREETYGDPEALRHAITMLPRGQREALEMLKLRELTLKEAAAQSGVGIAALKVAVHRAVKTLRRALATES